MFLQRFQKPKWQHRNPEIRRKALASLEADDPAVEQLAKSDADTSVRVLAARKLTDLATLALIANQDAAPLVNEAAASRLRQLLVGAAPSCPSLQARLDCLAHLNDPSLIEHLATNAKEEELKLAAIAKVERQSLLGKLASKDPAGRVRLQAVERITQRSTLEQVVKVARNKDKRVHRIARDRLDALTAKEQQPKRLQALCTELEALAAGQKKTTQAGIRRLRLEWAGLSAAADAELARRFEHANAAVESILRAQERDAEILNQKSAICESLESLVEGFDPNKQPVEHDPSEIQARVSELQSSWRQLPSIDSTTDSSVGQRFERVNRTIGAQRQHWTALLKRMEPFEALLQQARNLSHNKTVTENKVKALTDQWETIARSGAVKPLPTLSEQFAALRQDLKRLAKRHTEERTRIAQQTESFLLEIDSALRDGRLQDAISLQDSIRRNLKHLDSRERENFENRLQPCSARIRELRDWRRWGSDQARQDLIARAETLATTEVHPEQLAGQVREIRSEWQRLDKTDAATNEPLWARFNEACTKAYAPCLTYFEAQIREREANLQHREQILTTLKRELEVTDWEQPDWSAVCKRLRKTRAQWRDSGPVPRNQRRRIEKQLDESLQHYDHYLSAERERNFERRRALVEQAKQLEEVADLRKASVAAKQLQTQWIVTVPGGRRQEQALWGEFRGALERVFERKRQQHDERTRLLTANLAAKRALCEQLEAQAELDTPDPSDLTRTVQEAQDVWQGIGPVPHGEAESIERRLEQAIHGLEQTHREKKVQCAQTELDHLRDKVRICEKLERLTRETSDGVDQSHLLAAAQAQWKALPTKSGRTNKLIEERFRRAKRVLQHGHDEYASQDQLFENLERKRALCIRMEILAQIDSPTDVRQDRLAMQVNLLNQRMGEGRADSSTRCEGDSAMDLQREWYLIGPVPLEQSEAIEVRFRRAVDALRGK